jgi:hypothetical protein
LGPRNKSDDVENAKLSAFASPVNAPLADPPEKPLPM